jgi:hypothetical protein
MREQARAFARRFDGVESEVLVEVRAIRRRAGSGLRGTTRAALDGPDTLMGRRVPARLAIGGRSRPGHALADS